MQYSPKLKTAMAEIKEILKKHDIAGVVLLHTPGHGEFLSELNPSYSGVTVTGDEIRATVKLADFNGDKKAWAQKASDTSNMLMTFTQMGSHVLIPIMDLSREVDAVIDAGHDGPGFTSSHTTQNN